MISQNLITSGFTPGLSNERLNPSQAHMARQYDQAIEQMRKTLELDPNFPLAHCGLGMAYVQKSMYKEGIAEFERALVISPGYPMALSGLGYAYAVAGEKAEAQKMLDQLNEISKQKYVPALYRVGIYVGLGEKDKAFEWLEKSYADHSIGVGFGTPKVDPMFDPLRSDPPLPKTAAPDEPLALGRRK